MRVVVPADPYALTELLQQVAASDGPVYFRMNRNEVPAVYGTGNAGPATDLELGRAQVVRPGSDLTIVATGVMVARSVAAAEQLAGEGVQCRVIDLHTIKPLDAATLAAAARETGAIVTAEEHNVIGGLGGAVTEALAETCPVLGGTRRYRRPLHRVRPLLRPARPPRLLRRRRGGRCPAGTRAQDTGRMSARSV